MCAPSVLTVLMDEMTARAWSIPVRTVFEGTTYSDEMESGIICEFGRHVATSSMRAGTNLQTNLDGNFFSSTSSSLSFTHYYPSNL
jgi:hypothetical protein